MNQYCPNENLTLTLQEIESYRDQGSGKPSGKYLRYYCPIHGGDNQRSLSLDSETGRFKCFSCGAWGYLAEKRQERRRTNLSGPSWKADIHHNPTPLNQATSTYTFPKADEPPARPELVEPLRKFQEALPGGPGEEYLKQRGISLEVAQKYGLGYAAPGLWPNPKKYFLQGCIVFPHTNPAGEIVNLYGRGVDLNGDLLKQHRHAHLEGPKGIFNAQALTKDRAFITEGPFDAVSLLAAGHEACAIFGLNGLRWPWVKAATVVFGFDRDQAGESWRELACHAMLLGIEVYFLSRVTYAGYKDLSEAWAANRYLELGEWTDRTDSRPDNSSNISSNWDEQPEPQSDPSTSHSDHVAEIMSCAACPQYVAKEIEPGLPAFCLYWGEGLLIDNPICRLLQESLIPTEPVTTLTDLAAASPYGLAGLEYSQTLKGKETYQDRGDASHGGPPGEGRHLVQIKQVRGYLHNFEEYRGPRARLRMEILEGPAARRPLFDNISLPHSKESQGMLQRRLRIACRLGLIPWGNKETIQVNWKHLEGMVCWVDVAYKTFGRRKVPTVENYKLLNEEGKVGR